MNRGLPEVIQNMKLVFNKSKLMVFLLGLVNVLISIIVHINLFEKLQKLNDLQYDKDLTIEKVLEIFDNKFILALIISFIVPMVIYGILSIISSNVIFGEKISTSNFKCFINYIIMYLVLVFLIFFIIFAYIFSVVALVFLPIIGLIFIIFLSLAFIAFMIYFAGYYRYIPYVAVSDGLSKVFRKSKLYIKGNFIISIIALIFATIINQIMSWTYAQYKNDIYKLCIVIFILEVLLFIIYFFQISLVYTGKKSLTSAQEK